PVHVRALAVPRPRGLCGRDRAPAADATVSPLSRKGGGGHPRALPGLHGSRGDEGRDDASPGGSRRGDRLPPAAQQGITADMTWACPRCRRTFRQVNQRHACGVGSATTVLKGRPPALTGLYRTLEDTIRGFGEVEVVTR